MIYKCTNCEIKVKRTPSQVRGNIFCSKSCSASYNNKKFPKRFPEGKCFFCKKSCHKHNKYCSRECQKAYTIKKWSLLTKLKCKTCRKVKPISDFQIRSPNNRPCTQCKVCLHKIRMERAAKIKIQSIEYRGGKCSVCGYKKHLAALQFHHTEPEHKDFRISILRNRSFEKLKSELDKCIVLCANCHAVEHASDLWNSYLL